MRGCLTLFSVYPMQAHLVPDSSLRTSIIASITSCPCLTSAPWLLTGITWPLALGGCVVGVEVKPLLGRASASVFSNTFDLVPLLSEIYNIKVGSVSKVWNYDLEDVSFTPTAEGNVSWWRPLTLIFAIATTTRPTLWLGAFIRRCTIISQNSQMSHFHYNSYWLQIQILSRTNLLLGLYMVVYRLIPLPAIDHNIVVGLLSAYGVHQMTVNEASNNRGGLSNVSYL